MPEGFPKLPQPESPVARTGAGDISERELSRERHNLQSTPPPTRVQPAHPKKQLFSVPVNKFTAKCSPHSQNLARIRSCLADYESQATPTRPPKIGPKAISMEDLTPAKRIRRERSDLPTVQSPGLQSSLEQAAGSRICRLLLLAVWRRRRDEVRCLRKTVEFQVSCSERLRIQVSALKSLLDSDNSKVRLAMKELERLKQLLRDKEMEKAVLEREKLALENDVCVAEDRASEMSIGWRNARNEAEGVRAAAAVCEHALTLERQDKIAAHKRALALADKLSAVEVDLSHQADQLSSAEAEVCELREQLERDREQLAATHAQLRDEKELRSHCVRECASSRARETARAAEVSQLRGAVTALQAEVAALAAALATTREQLDWWPAPLTKMMGVARSWLRRPLSVPEVVLWTLVPARHGC